MGPTGPHTFWRGPSPCRFQLLEVTHIPQLVAFFLQQHCMTLTMLPRSHGPLTLLSPSTFVIKLSLPG